MTRSRAKLTRMRGENCMEASVSVISRMANTMDTTVMVEVAISLRMTCATWGSEWDGKSSLGTHALIPGKDSSSAREQRSRGAQRQRDGQRANQKAAAQVVHHVAK